MFLLNLGYRWTLPTEVEGLGGVVLLPAHNSSGRVLRDPPAGSFKRLLFDPQLYLSSLALDGRVKTCGRLATYPWFGVEGVEPFDPSQAGLRDWEGAAREVASNAWSGRPPTDVEASALAAVDFQARIGCSHIVLPAPLIAEREDEGESAGTWLDAGVEAAHELEVPHPLLASVIVSQGALNETAFGTNGLLEAIVDHVTARAEDLEGVYIVVVQTHRPCHPFEVAQEVARAYLQLARSFAGAGMAQVIVNFADLAGLVTCAVGVIGFATGPSMALRGMNIEAFLDDGGGIALPQYYSHKVAGEFLSESDLDRLVARRAFRRIADRTSFSSGLVQQLLAGGSARDVLGWAESQNNIKAAQQHFVQRLVEEGRRLRRNREIADRRDAVVEWLEAAEANALFVQARMGRGVSVPGRRAPVTEWAQLIGG